MRRRLRDISCQTSMSIHMDQPFNITLPALGWRDICSLQQQLGLENWHVNGDAYAFGPCGFGAPILQVSRHKARVRQGIWGLPACSLFLPVSRATPAMCSTETGSIQVEQRAPSPLTSLPPVCS